MYSGQLDVASESKYRNSWTFIMVLLCTPVRPVMMTWLFVDAIKDYETEIIKISALSGVRPSCGQGVVLATNIIIVMAVLCSVTE